MRGFCIFAFTIIIFVASGLAQPVSSRYLAFCTDGDGALSDWVVSRSEAYIAGRDHEHGHRGHRWEVLVQQGEVAIRPSRCAALADDPSRPDTVRVVNTCGSCRIFRIARRSADGSVRSKEFTLKPNTQRRFAKRANSEIVVEGESDCPGT